MSTTRKLCDGIDIDANAKRALNGFRSKFKRLVEGLRHNNEVIRKDILGEKRGAKQSFDFEGIEEHQLEELLQFGKLDGEEWEDAAPKVDSQVGLSAQMHSLLESIRPCVPAVVHQRLLIVCGKTLTDLKQYESANKECFSKVLKSSDPVEGFNADNMCLEVQSEFGRAWCLHQLIISEDGPLLFRNNVDKILDVLKIVQGMLQKLFTLRTEECESMSWLVFNGTIYIVRMCKPLIDRGYVFDALPMVKFALLSLESVLPLLSPSYLDWRMSVYEIIISCYLSLGRTNSAILAIERARGKLNELQQWQEADPPIPADVTASIEKSRSRLESLLERCNYLSANFESGGIIQSIQEGKKDVNQALSACVCAVMDPRPRTSDNIGSGTEMERVAAILNGAADIMQEHFDEIKKHMQSPQLEDTEEDQTSGEKVEVPGDRIVSSRLDTSYINDRIDPALHVALLQKSCRWSTAAVTDRLLKFMTLRREHLPLELERRLVAVQLVASLRETDRINWQRISELSGCLLEGEGEFPIRDVLLEAIVAVSEGVLAPLFKEAILVEENDTVRQICTLFQLWTRLEPRDALMVGVCALELSALLEGQAAFQLAVQLTQSALAVVARYRADAVKQLPPKHSVRTYLTESDASNSMYNAVLCVHANLLMCSTRVRLAEADSRGDKARRCLERSMLEDLSHNHSERAILLLAMSFYRKGAEKRSALVRKAMDALQLDERNQESREAALLALQTRYLANPKSEAKLAPPALQWVTTTSIALRPFMTSESGDIPARVSSVRVFGKSSEKGNNVSITDCKLHGLGVDVSADELVIVKGLRPNLPYVFAQQRSPTTEAGSSTPMGALSVEVATCFPLPPAVCWAFVCLTARRLELHEYALDAAKRTLVCVRADDAGSPWPSSWRARLRFRGVLQARVETLPAPLLQLCSQVLHVVVDTLNVPTAITAPSAHVKSLVPAELFLCKLAQYLSLALELASAINDVQAVHELILRMYRTLLPLLDTQQAHVVVLQPLVACVEHARAIGNENWSAALNSVVPRIVDSLIRIYSSVGQLQSLDENLLLEACDFVRNPSAEAEALRSRIALTREHAHLISKGSSDAARHPQQGRLEKLVSLSSDLKEVVDSTLSNDILALVCLEGFRRGQLEDVRKWLPEAPSDAKAETPEETSEDTNDGTTLPVDEAQNGSQLAARSMMEMVRALSELCESTPSRPPSYSTNNQLGWEWESFRNVGCGEIPGEMSKLVDPATDPQGENTDTNNSSLESASSPAMLLSEKFFTALNTSLELALRAQAWQQMQNSLRVLYNALVWSGKSPRELKQWSHHMQTSCELSIQMLEECRTAKLHRDDASPSNAAYEDNDASEGAEEASVSPPSEQAAKDVDGSAPASQARREPTRRAGLHLSFGMRYSAKHHLLSQADWCSQLWFTTESHLDVEMLYGVVRWTAHMLFAVQSWSSLVALLDNFDRLTDSVYGAHYLPSALYAQSLICSSAATSVVDTQQQLAVLDTEMQRERDESARRRALRRSRVGKKKEDENLAEIERSYLEKREKLNAQHQHNLSVELAESQRQTRLRDLYRELMRDRSVCLQNLDLSRAALSRAVQFEATIEASERDRAFEDAVASYSSTIRLCRMKRETILASRASNELGDLLYYRGRAREAASAWKGVLENLFGVLNASKQSLDSLVPVGGEKKAFESVGVWNLYAAALALAKLGRFIHVRALDEREACGRLACSLAFVALTGVTVAHPPSRALLASHRLDAQDGVFPGVDAHPPPAMLRCPLGGLLSAMQFAAEHAMMSRRYVDSFAPLLLLLASCERSGNASLYVKSSARAVVACIEAGAIAAGVARLQRLVFNMDIPDDAFGRRRRYQAPTPLVVWRDDKRADDAENVAAARAILSLPSSSDSAAFEEQNASVELARLTVLASLGAFARDEPVYAECLQLAREGLADMARSYECLQTRAQASLRLAELESRCGDVSTAYESLNCTFRTLEEAAAAAAPLDVLLYFRVEEERARLLVLQARFSEALQVCECIDASAAKTAYTAALGRVAVIRADALAGQGLFSQALASMESCVDGGRDHAYAYGWRRQAALLEAEFRLVDALDCLERAADVITEDLNEHGLNEEEDSAFAERPERAPAASLYLPMMAAMVSTCAHRSRLLHALGFSSEAAIQALQARRFVSRIPITNRPLQALVCQVESLTTSHIQQSKRRVCLLIEHAHSCVPLRNALLDTASLCWHAVSHAADGEEPRATSKRTSKPERRREAAYFLWLASRASSLSRAALQLASTNSSTVVSALTAADTNVLKQIQEARTTNKAESLRQLVHRYTPEDVERLNSDAVQLTATDVTIRELILYVEALKKEANGPWTSEHLQNWLTDAHSLLLKSLPSYASECCLQVDEVNNVAPLPDVLVALHWRDVVGAPTQCELFGCCKQISIVNGTEQETDSGTDEALSIIRGRFEKEKVSSVWILTGRVVVALKHQSPDDQVQTLFENAISSICDLFGGSVSLPEHVQSLVSSEGAMRELQRLFQFNSSEASSNEAIATLIATVSGSNKHEASN